MNGQLVADIVTGQNDYGGLRITTVYSKVTNVYAVYANAERIMVQFSDEEKLAQDQRLALAHLAPVRGEINGIIDGWRSARWEGNRSRAKRYDRRTADALVVALQGDQVSAESLLDNIKADILEERTSIGRAQYLLFAAFCALIVFLFFWWLTPETDSQQMSPLGKFTSTNNLWLATGVGCLGAFFSIALGIRNREIKTDLRQRDNFVDATLRIMIGAISAFILFSLIKTHLVTLMVGSTTVALAADGKSISPDVASHMAIVVAFLAGFSERLVGNFLSSAVLVSVPPKAAVTGQGDAKNLPIEEKKRADEKNPLGNPEVIAKSLAQAELDDATDADQAIDNCLCETNIAEEDKTVDEELPKSSGGIEKGQ